ncbi:hypothetical protein HDV06_007176 [Boothiomyces sp. JEL0866]|nr:hypothetical protein HDV06_007176 [Boothiomyces sp. JEL0866]
MQKTKLSKILEKYLGTCNHDMKKLESFDCQTLQSCASEIKLLVQKEFQPRVADVLYALELNIISRPWQEQYPDLWNAISNLNQVIDQTNRDLQVRIKTLYDRINKPNDDNLELVKDLQDSFQKQYPENVFTDIFDELSAKALDIQVHGLLYDESRIERKAGLAPTKGGELSLKQAPGETSGVLFLPMHIRPGGPISPEELNNITNQYNQVYMSFQKSMRSARSCAFCFPCTIFGICCCAPCIFMWLAQKKSTDMMAGLDQDLFALTDKLNKSFGIRGLLFQLTKGTVGQIDTYSNGMYARSSAINAYQLNIYWNPAYQQTIAPLGPVMTA